MQLPIAKLFLLAGLFGPNVMLVSDTQSSGTEKNTPHTPGLGPQIKWERTVHDFGAIPEGLAARTTFKFKNTGDSDLLIFQVLGSGPNYSIYTPSHPVKPGKSDSVVVGYWTEGRPGPFNKAFSVETNIPDGTECLMIKGTVVRSSPGDSSDK